MSLNPDRNKPKMFSRKLRKGFHFNLSFNDQSFGINCISDKINKILKGVGLLRKLTRLLPL